jgi:hypothetical protein
MSTTALLHAVTLRPLRTPARSQTKTQDFTSFRPGLLRHRPFRSIESARGRAKHAALFESWAVLGEGLGDDAAGGFGAAFGADHGEGAAEGDEGEAAEEGRPREVTGGCDGGGLDGWC